MATNTFNSIHHHNYSLLTHRHATDSPLSPATTTNCSSFFLKPIAAAAYLTLSHSSAVSSTSTTTTTTTTTITITNDSTQITNEASFELLHQHLTSKNFRQADEETRLLLIALAGDAAQKRGYIFFSEVQFISEDDLKTIDGLWRKHSDNKYGYSVQKRIWKKVKGDFTRYFIEVGWMKKLQSCEVEQYNYRSFPAEFVWEMEEGAPEGHLPLTNALRGTRLLNSILNHPAFEEKEDDRKEILEKKEIERHIKVPLMSKNSFKPNYTF